MKFDRDASHRRTAFSQTSRAVGLAIAAGVAAVLASLSPANSLMASDPADDDFESGGLVGGTGWLTDWQTTGSVDVVNFGSPRTDSLHLRLRAGDGGRRRSGWR